MEKRLYIKQERGRLKSILHVFVIPTACPDLSGEVGILLVIRILDSRFHWNDTTFNTFETASYPILNYSAFKTDNFTLVTFHIEVSND